MTLQVLDGETGLTRDATPDEEAAILALQNAPTPIPQKLTRRQAKQALILAGLIDRVQPAIDAITDATQRALMQVEWDDSLNFERSHEPLVQIGTAIGLDAAGIDNLFISGSKL